MTLKLVADGPQDVRGRWKVVCNDREDQSDWSGRTFEVAADAIDGGPGPQCGSCLTQYPRASTSLPGDTEVDSVSEPAVSETETEPGVTDLVSDSEPEVIDLVSDSEPEVADTPEPEVVDTLEPDLVSENEWLWRLWPSPSLASPSLASLSLVFVFGPLCLWPLCLRSSVSGVLFRLRTAAIFEESKSQPLRHTLAV